MDYMENLKQARLDGLRRYLGKPCIHGHGDEVNGNPRYVRDYECIRCHSIKKQASKKRQRLLRGPVKLGRPRKYAIVEAKPKKVNEPWFKTPPKTDFEYWIARSRVKNSERKAIPYEVYMALYVTHCPLLGIELTYAHGKGNTPHNYATLDKIDPSKGYVEGNIHVVSARANTIKNDASVDELRTIANNLEKILQSRT